MRLGRKIVIAGASALVIAGGGTAATAAVMSKTLQMASELGTSTSALTVKCPPKQWITRDAVQQADTLQSRIDAIVLLTCEYDRH